MLINSFLNQTYADEIKHAQRENTSKAEKAGSVPDFAQMMEDRQLKCPYGYLAEKLGISRQYFRMKCKNKADFTNRETDILCSELGITSLTEKEKIFFKK